MRRERRNQNEEDKIKWGRLISFLIAIVLLGVAIAISMTQERKISEVNYNVIKSSNNVTILPTEEASSELGKSVNEVQEENTLTINQISGGDNEEENDEEINNIVEDIETNANVITNETNKNSNKEEKEEEKKNINQFIYPVSGEIIKEFAKDNLIYSETLEEWITHNGIDIKAERATVVKAVADGTVKSIKNDPRYGLTVTIEHSNGYTSSYSSLLTAEFVKEGEKITQGQTIGTVGNSAVFESAEDNHLHFELLKDGSNINPEMYLK